MKFAVVDLQGFLVDKVFCPKELTLKRSDDRAVHLLIKPARPFCNLSESDKRQVNFLENNHSGLRYSSGYVEPEEIRHLLRTYLQGVEQVYVKGHQKEYFLRDVVDVEVINVEQYTTVPKFQKTFTTRCPHHFAARKWMCSLENCELLHKWLVTPPCRDSTY